jgi:hypothetical protein
MIFLAGTGILSIYFTIMPRAIYPRAIYPRDITREQLEVIRPQLDNFKKTTKPRALDVYDVFCAIVYVMKSCCQ